jgi:hypothetical protein
LEGREKSDVLEVKKYESNEVEPVEEENPEKEKIPTNLDLDNGVYGFQPITKIERSIED